MANVKKSPKVKSNDLEAKLKRALADYANLEKRFAKESASVIKFSNASLLEKMLEVKDNLERAALTIQNEGIDLVLDQLEEILEEEQVTEIKEKIYNPNTMECEEVVPGEKDQVVETVQKGYLLHDKLLRPAKVKVGSGITVNKSNQKT